MTARSPELDVRISELDSAFSDEELVDLFLALARRPGRDAPTMLVSLAAGWSAEGPESPKAAATLSTLLGSSIASLQDVYSVPIREVAVQLGGEPQHVLDALEWSAMNQALLQGEAIRSIWQEPMLRTGDAAVALGARATNREKVRRLRERSALLGLPSGNVFLYPAFQFDPGRRAIFPEVVEINELLDAAGDPWGVASWWIGDNARLAERPVDCVGTERAGDLIEAAEALVEPVG